MRKCILNVENVFFFFFVILEAIGHRVCNVIIFDSVKCVALLKTINSVQYILWQRWNGKFNHPHQKLCFSFRVWWSHKKVFFSSFSVYTVSVDVVALKFNDCNLSKSIMQFFVNEVWLPKFGGAFVMQKCLTCVNLCKFSPHKLKYNISMTIFKETWLCVCYTFSLGETKWFEPVCGTHIPTIVCLWPNYKFSCRKIFYRLIKFTHF